MSINPVPVPLQISLTAGPTPTDPATLDNALIAAVAAEVPDYTANLPGSLIEDISSTDIGALVTIDQARVDAVNSVSPYTANPFVLSQQGTMYGIPQGQPTNTSAYVVLTGPVGYIIPSGFLVGDGSNQYSVQEAGVINSGGQSQPIYVLATQPGSWTPLAGTINQIVSSVPSGYSLTVTNPTDGLAGSSGETVESYRSRVMQAGQASCQGVTTLITSMLQAIPGVVTRLVRVAPMGPQVKVICGGGDPYQIANAIFQSTIACPQLVISNTASRNIVATITDYPNTYTIRWVNPVPQTLTLAVTWDTSFPGFVAGDEVNSQTQIAFAQYINSIPVGQPINLLQMTSIFQSANANLLTIDQIDYINFSAQINGNPVASPTGTNLILSLDDESYFTATTSAITVTQG
jgi:hypothetical protein